MLEGEERVLLGRHVGCVALRLLRGLMMMMMMMMMMMARAEAGEGRVERAANGRPRLAPW